MGGLTRHHVLFSFFSFGFHSLLSGDEKAISLLLSGSTQPTAGFSVAHVDDGKWCPLEQLLSSTKENSEMSLVVAVGGVAKR